MKFLFYFLISHLCFNSCKRDHITKFSVDYVARKNDSKVEDIRESYNYFKVNNLLVYVMEKYSLDSIAMSKEPNEIEESDFKRGKKRVVGYFVYDAENSAKKGLLIPSDNNSYIADVDSFFNWNGTNAKSEEDNFKNMVLVAEEKLQNSDLVRKFVNKKEQNNFELSDSLIVFYNSEFSNLNYSVLEGGYALKGKSAYRKIHVGFIPDDKNQKNKHLFYILTVEIVKHSFTNDEEKIIKEIKKQYMTAF